MHNAHDVFAFRHCKAIVARFVGFLHPTRECSLNRSTLNSLKLYQQLCLLLVAFLTWQGEGTMDTIATDSRYNNSTSLGRDGGHGIVPPKSTCSTRMYDVAKL